MRTEEPETNVRMFTKPTIFSRFRNVIAAESTRHGGISPAPFHSLNLGGTLDSADNVLKNNQIFFAALQVTFEQVAKAHQVHGTDILNVTAPGRFEAYDALITNQPNIQLAISIADCTPILILDPVANACAAIHAGWRGTVDGIVSKTVKAMQDHFGTNPANCVGYVGTCIDQCSFEVGTEVADHFSVTHKRWDEARQKFFVNLKAANRDQLLLAGLPSENIEVSPYSTVTHNSDYFSHRKENGQTGRLLATIGIHP